MKQKILWSLIGLALAAAIAFFAFTGRGAVDTRYSGAYTLEDRSFVFIAPDGGDRLRYRKLSGESGLLWPAGRHRFTGGKGWNDRAPVFNAFTFEIGNDGRASALTWEQPAAAAIHARKAEISEEIVTFRSGSVTLRAKLVRPAGQKPQPAVVIVHDSEKFSAVDRYFEPYLYAASGFTALVFDKRGTGKSQGRYTRNFGVLADDVVAAVRWLREQPRVDGARVHLAAFGEGGWVAPLAAVKEGRIRSVLVCFGAMVPVVEQDRWGYVYALRDKGFGDAEIAQADAINAVISDIVDKGENRWGELGRLLDEAREAAWFDAVRGSESTLGLLASTRLPLWMVRLHARWEASGGDQPFIDRLYDPVPTALLLRPPSYWIFGEQDAGTPTEETLDKLNTLQRRGKPVDYLVYPDSGHGILRLMKNPDGTRQVLGYEPDYFKLQVDWLRRNSRTQ